MTTAPISFAGLHARIEREIKAAVSAQWAAEFQRLEKLYWQSLDASNCPDCLEPWKTHAADCLVRRGRA